MKFLDRLALAVFSIIVFVLAVLVCLLLFGWFDIEILVTALEYLKSNEIATNVTIGVCIVLLLLAIKAMFFESYSSEEDKSREGILLENDNGKLLVSRDTLENLATNVAKTESGVENVASRVILDKDNNLIIFINLLVKSDALIKNLSLGLQEKIKQTVKESLGLELKEVNIKIKNITSDKNDKNEKTEKQLEKTVEKVSVEKVPVVKEEK